MAQNVWHNSGGNVNFTTFLYKTPNWVGYVEMDNIQVCNTCRLYIILVKDGFEIVPCSRSSSCWPTIFMSGTGPIWWYCLVPDLSSQHRSQTGGREAKHARARSFLWPPFLFCLPWGGCLCILSTRVDALGSDDWYRYQFSIVSCKVSTAYATCF